MRIQFGMRSLLLATAFVAMTIAAGLLIGRRLSSGDWGLVFRVAAVCGPFWIPILFLAYALGRRALTGPLVVTFALAEGLAQGVAWSMLP